MTVLIAIVLVALIFDFLNGFHDAANSIATVVSTRVLSPQLAERFGGDRQAAKLFSLDRIIAEGGGLSSANIDVMLARLRDPKERERILQSMNEGFPSHYAKLLERYYTRLADEKSAASDEKPPAKPTAKPVAEKSPAKPAASGAAGAQPAPGKDSK